MDAPLFDRIEEALDDAWRDAGHNGPHPLAVELRQPKYKTQAAARLALIEMVKKYRREVEHDDHGADAEKLQEIDDVLLLADGL